MRRLARWTLVAPLFSLSILITANDANAQCDTSCGTFTVYDRTKTHFGLGACEYRDFAPTTYCCGGGVLSQGPFNCSMNTGVEQLECPPNCCTPTAPSCGGLGTITQYDCDTAAVDCSFPCPENLEGTCFDNGECPAADKNPHPMRFTTGDVETNPIEVFLLPTPVDVPFGFILRWSSRPGHLPVRWSTHNPPRPLIQMTNQTNNYIGDGWSDIYSDRLYVHAPSAGETIPANPSVINWQSFDLSRTFHFVSIVSGYGRYVTAGGDYELRDYGVGVTPRFRIIQLQQLKVWEFSAYTFTSPQNNPGMIGLLSKISVPANETTFGGGYYVSISRDIYGRINYVEDPFGRRIQFVHSQPDYDPADPDSTFPHIEAIDLVPGPGLPSVPVATFEYLRDAVVLGAIHMADERRGGYYRFHYKPWRRQDGQVACATCRGLLAEIIVPAVQPTSSPAIECAITGSPPCQTCLDEDGCPLGDNEFVLEGHDYDEERRAILTYGPAAKFGYVHEDVCGDEDSPCMREYDLLAAAPPPSPPPAPSPTCSTGCPAGYACYDTSQGGNGGCYRFTDISFDVERQAVTSKIGNCPDCDVYYEYLDGRLRSVSSDGATTSFSWAGPDQLACMVHNDSNSDAGDPATGCDVPATQDAFAVAFVRTNEPSASTTTTRKVSRSLVPGGLNATDIVVSDYNGRVKSITREGYTRNLAGNAVFQSRVTTYSYDNYGRLTKIDGPLANNESDDRTFSRTTRPGM